MKTKRYAEIAKHFPKKYRVILFKHFGYLNRKKWGEFADLTGADLRGADLSKAWLDGISFKHADLSYSNFTGAQLLAVNFYGSNLRLANFSSSNLTGAKFRNANLKSLIGNGREIKTIQADFYLVNLFKKFIVVGCQKFTYKEFYSLCDCQIFELGGANAVSWYKKWSPILKLIQIKIDE